MRPRVVFVYDAPFPYLVPCFDAVARRNNLDFEAWFWGRRANYSQPWQFDESAWAFDYRYLPSLPWRWNNRIAVPTPLLVPGRSKPDLLVTYYVGPLSVLPWLAAYRRGIATAIWTFVYFERWIPRVPWKEKLARYMFSRTDGVITLGPDGRSYARGFGTPDERIHYARFGIDFDRFAPVRAGTESERDSVRATLGLRGVTFIYVGRLEPGKGLPHLLDAFAILQRRMALRGEEVSLLLVGEGKDRPKLEARCEAEGVRNVVFAGFQQTARLPTYFAAGDVFVFPSLGDPYGLVVDEALASGLPVISTTIGEITERVDEGESGFVVPPANSAALLDRMERLVVDAALRKEMGKVAAERIREFTPERWAAEFEGAVEQILARGGSAQERPHTG